MIIKRVTGSCSAGCWTTASTTDGWSAASRYSGVVKLVTNQPRAASLVVMKAGTRAAASASASSSPSQTCAASSKLCMNSVVAMSSAVGRAMVSVPRCPTAVGCLLVRSGCRMKALQVAAEAIKSASFIFLKSVTLAVWAEALHLCKQRSASLSCYFQGPDFAYR